MIKFRATLRWLGPLIALLALLKAGVGLFALSRGEALTFYRRLRASGRTAKTQLLSRANPAPSWDRPTFSTATSLWLTLSLMLIGIGLTAAVAFVGQTLVEWPYHLYGRETVAVVGGRWEELDTAREVPIRYTEVTVYYFREDLQRVVSARLREAARLKQNNLVPGAEVRVVYLPDRIDEVMPREVLDSAGKEIVSGLLGGLAIAFPGTVLLFWLKKSGRLG